MSSFRSLIAGLDSSDELLRVSREVDPVYELGDLLKQAESRRKGILFENVSGSEFPVAGSLLTSPARFGGALEKADPAKYSAVDHAADIAAAMNSPVAVSEVSKAACKEVVLTGADADCSKLPVPTFFAGDSGPFLTAAVGISRNPENGVVNAGFYRIWVAGENELVVSASPSSDLHRFIKSSTEAVSLVLAIGVEPALLMAAAAKVPASISELDVAGALQGEALQVTAAEACELPVPANAEFVIELELDPRSSVENTMGEFGDQYGTQNAFRAAVKTITHRSDAIFHAIMAGAGREHNSLGKIILYGVEPDLQRELAVGFPEVSAVRVLFEPPRMGVRGDVYVSLKGGRSLNAAGLVEHVYSLTCGLYPLARIIRRVVLLDEDIDLQDRRKVDWAIATRAVDAKDYFFYDSPGAVRIGIDARKRSDAGMESLEIPGAGSRKLDDYLG